MYTHKLDQLLIYKTFEYHSLSQVVHPRLCPSTEFLFMEEKSTHFFKPSRPIVQTKSQPLSPPRTPSPQVITVPAGHGLNDAMMKHLLNKLGVFPMFREAKKKIINKHVWSQLYIYIYTRDHKYCIPVGHQNSTSWRTLKASQIYDLPWSLSQRPGVFGINMMNLHVEFCIHTAMACLLSAIMSGKYLVKNTIYLIISQTPACQHLFQYAPSDLQLFFLAGESTSPQQTSFDTHGCITTHSQKKSWRGLGEFSVVHPLGTSYHLRSMVYIVTITS